MPQVVQYIHCHNFGDTCEAIKNDDQDLYEETIQYFASENNSPSVASEMSKGGSKACISKAILQACLIKGETKEKSHSGGNDIFGFTFMDRITV